MYLELIRDILYLIIELFIYSYLYEIIIYLFVLIIYLIVSITRHV